MKFLNVEKVQKISEDVFEIFLVKEDVDFKVGNCMAIYGPDGKTSRPYSFASGINDNFLSFIIKKFPNGYVSTYLCSLTQGDRVKVSNPYGWFHPGEDINSIYISTGTGIAPFMSSLRSSYNPPAHFLIGAKHYVDYSYYLPFIGQKCPYTYCLSRDKLEYRGHVTSRLREMFDTFPVDAHYYMCGLDSMIDECMEFFLSKNVSTDKIHHEKFFTSAV
jgi:ferredoxin-NADP reductase